MLRGWVTSENQDGHAKQIIAHLADLGAEPFPISTGQFDKFIVAQTEKWGRVIRAGNITLD